ncbi:hypothetical protein ACIA4I_07725 [Lactobacillus delbrueckii subsp. bulgaricus]
MFCIAFCIPILQEAKPAAMGMLFFLAKAKETKLGGASARQKVKGQKIAAILTVFDP